MGPVVDAPDAEVPVAEAPVAEAPVAEAPVAEARVAEATVAEAPVGCENVDHLVFVAAKFGFGWIAEIELVQFVGPALL